jgi:hypothetical protein
LLLMAAGVEMDSEFAALCRQMQGGSPRGGACFGLAMAAFSEPHWSALTPFRPLRRYRLLELEPGQGLTAATLRIDERILHYLAGVNAPDQRLQPFIQAILFPSQAAKVVTSVPDGRASPCHGCVCATPPSRSRFSTSAAMIRKDRKTPRLSPRRRCSATSLRFAPKIFPRRDPNSTKWRFSSSAKACFYPAPC